MCSLVTNKRYNLKGNKLHHSKCYSISNPNQELRNSLSSLEIKPLMLKSMTGKFQQPHHFSDSLKVKKILGHATDFLESTKL